MYKEDLERILNRIDSKSYPAYKDIRGKYDFADFTLSVDHVQGDPFAGPSRCRVIIDNKRAGFPVNLFDSQNKRIAFCDFLTRCFSQSIYKYYDSVGGSGKSGLLTIDRPGQEMLLRTSVSVNRSTIEARFEVGLPAAGRRVLGKSAIKIFLDYLPKVVDGSLKYRNINQGKLDEHIKLSVDQVYLRDQIRQKGLVGFVANGSILPRQSGISDAPMKEGAIAFMSPSSMEVEFTLPNKGLIKGMGIKEGITLIAGGGYHGKSTLLNALQLGVYNHIPGDGREFVMVNEDAVKIRAEDGRRVQSVNISPFINNLPNNQNTRSFSTENASGSTSQATNIIEAIEVGTSVLLIDEDTSATNFMIRDSRMQRLVAKEKEPITPFVDKVANLYKDKAVSTVLVVGGSGDYFDVADNVIVMDEYRVYDKTAKAKEIAMSLKTDRQISTDKPFGDVSNRVILKKAFPADHKGRKIQAKGLTNIMYNKSKIELDALEQLMDSSQTNCLAMMMEYVIENLVDDKTSLIKIIDRLYTKVENEGLEAISRLKGHPGNLALPTKAQFASTLNRFRHLEVKGIM